MRRKQILILYDVPDWAYFRRAEALRKYAPKDVDVWIQPADVAAVLCKSCDLVFLLDYVQAERVKAIINGRCPLVASFNSGPARRQKEYSWLHSVADHVVVNNRERFEHDPRFNNSTWITNGVDTEIFRPIVPFEQRPQRVLWCGSDIKPCKRYEQILKPLKAAAMEAGFECDFRPMRSPSAGMSTNELVAWYNSGRYVACASTPGHEGTPNLITEGVACGCLAISTMTGNILEWGTDCHDCMICHPSWQAFLAALRLARADCAERKASIGAGVVAARYAYAHHAAEYFNLFARLIAKYTGQAT